MGCGCNGLGRLVKGKKRLAKHAGRLTSGSTEKVRVNKVCALVRRKGRTMTRKNCRIRGGSAYCDYDTKLPSRITFKKGKKTYAVRCTSMLSKEPMFQARFAVD